MKDKAAEMAAITRKGYTNPYLQKIIGSFFYRDHFQLDANNDHMIMNVNKGFSWIVTTVKKCSDTTSTSIIIFYLDDIKLGYGDKQNLLKAFSISNLLLGKTASHT